MTPNDALRVEKFLKQDVREAYQETRRRATVSEEQLEAERRPSRRRFVEQGLSATAKRCLDEVRSSPGQTKTFNVPGCRVPRVEASDIDEVIRRLRLRRHRLDRTPRRHRSAAPDQRDDHHEQQHGRADKRGDHQEQTDNTTRPNPRTE